MNTRFSIPSTQRGGAGIAVIVIVILLVIAGGLYLWKSSEKVPVDTSSTTETSNETSNPTSGTSAQTSVAGSASIKAPAEGTSDININPADLNAAMGF